mmetsp:Transcript_1524/g.3268  ORF Transcript_1524/g.3268 Transcript_1524/m.3268 type:complete len:342 (+) Transcript_1524:68-1093(+)
MRSKCPDSSRVLRSVSIIGLQSSGKSTILNEMFGTPFEVLRRGEGTQQTTKGINVFATRELIILDVEGTDSQERHQRPSSSLIRGTNEAAASTENKLALFALMATEVLIINVQAEAVGRQTSLCLSVIKKIFEVSLRSPKRQAKRQIIFFLRDYCSEDYSKQTLYRQIETRIGEVWERISKPAKFQRSSLKEFCDLGYICFPHKVYQATKFKARIQKVVPRFLNPRSPRYVFKLHSELICKPADIPMYYQSLWKEIRADRSLDTVSSYEAYELQRAKAELASRTFEADLLILVMIFKQVEDAIKAELHEQRMDAGRRQFDASKQQFDDYMRELDNIRRRFE